MTIMEEIAAKLKLSETKQRSVGKAHEILRAQADSMLAFTLNWNDLDDHFDSVRNSLYAAFVGLLEREKEIGSRFADLEVKEKEFDSAMAVKGRELQGIVREVEEGKSQLQSIKFEKCSVEEGRLGKVQKLVKGKEMEYYNMQQRMKELSKEIEAKERQLNVVRGKVVEQWKEFDLRDDEIRAQQTLIEEYDREVKSKEQKLGLIEKDLCELEKSVGEWDCKVELKQLELKRSVQKAKKQFESKSEELNLIGRRVNDCLNDVQLKEKKLDSREKHLDSLDKSIQECGRRLEQKAKELELKQQEYESKAEELDLIDMRVNDCLKDVQLKEKDLDSREKHLDSLNNSIQECGRRLEQGAKELELKQQEFEKSKEEHIRTDNSEEKTDILHTQVKIEQLGRFPDNISVPPFCATGHSRIIRDGRSLQFFMNEYFRRTDSVSVEVSACLQLSSDAAKLVIDAMQGFYPSSSTVENREFDFDLSVIRRSCIHLLKEVKRVSPKISHQVKAEAKKLAGEWRARMTVAAENWLEVLGFLWLVTAYDLTSISDREELQSLLGIAANHEKQSDELYGILDREDKTPARSNLCSSVKTKKPESSLGRNAATCSSPYLQLTATSDAKNSQGFPTCSSPNIQLTATTDARNLQRLSNEQFSGNHSIQNEFLQIAKLFSALDGDVLVKCLGLISQNKQALEYIRSSGFGDKIPDAIPTLIERRQRIEAVRAICTFNLVDKFPPVPLLKEHVDTGMNSFQSLSSKTKLVGEKIKIADDYMADLRAVIQCIKDYNLESEYPPSVIETKLAKLQNDKDRLKHTENWRSLAPCHKVEQKQKRGRKRSARFQAQQLKFKCQRAAVSAPAPHPIPNPTPGYAPPNPSYVTSENGGHPWQFGMAGSNVDISKGICFHCNGLGHWKRNCPKYLSEKKNGDVIKSQCIKSLVNKEICGILLVTKDIKFMKRPFAWVSAFLVGQSLWLISTPMAQSRDIIKPNAIYETAELFELGIQLSYLLLLLGFLGVGTFFVIRQVLVRRELDLSAKELQEQVRSGDADATELFELGAVMLRRKIYPAAIKYLVQAIEKWDGDDQDLAQVYNALGVSYVREGKLAKGITQFETAVKLQPGYVTAWNNLGDAYEKRKDFKAALKAFEEVLLFDPNNKVAIPRRDTLMEQVKMYRDVPVKTKEKSSDSMR